MSNQVHRRLRHFRQVGGLSMTVYVHVEDARAFKEEVVVEGSHFETVIEEGGHDRIDLVFLKHEVPHHYVHTAVTLGHREPSAEAKRRRRCNTINSDL